MLFRTGFTWGGPQALWGFATSSHQIYVKTKKVLPFDCGVPGTVPYAKPALVIALRS